MPGFSPRTPLQKLDSIREHLRRISPGPWYRNALGEIVDYEQTDFDDPRLDRQELDSESAEYRPPIYGFASGGLMAYRSPTDVLFLLLCRNDYVPWLVDQVAELEAELAGNKKRLMELSQALIECEMRERE